jgi:hypothetical protein
LLRRRSLEWIGMGSSQTGWAWPIGEHLCFTCIFSKNDHCYNLK